MAALNQQKAESANAQAQNQVEQMSTVAKVEAENAIREALTKELQPDLDKALQASPIPQADVRSKNVQDVVDETIKTALSSLNTRIDARTQEQVAAVKKVLS